MPPDDSGAAALADALAQLYAVLPEEFVATRTRLVQEAKAAGEAKVAKELGRARRPTVAAWAVNSVVRERPEQAERLQSLGQRMRAAQADLDVAVMNRLQAERDHFLGTWADDADAAGRRAGRPLTAAVGEEVRATLIAALAEEEATRAVLSGQLTRSLRYSGFGGVDLSEAVVRTSSGAVLSVVPGAAKEPATGGDEPEVKSGGRKGPDRHTSRGPASGEKATKKATKKGKEKATEEQADQKSEKAEARAAKEKAAEDEAAAARAAADRERVEAARQAHEAAVEAAKEAKQALDQARDRADETRWRVEELEDQLKQARAEHRAAEQTATEAARARRSAGVEVARAEKAVRDARGSRG